jgi:hypothetical protein
MLASHREGGAAGEILMRFHQRSESDFGFQAGPIEDVLKLRQAARQQSFSASWSLRFRRKSESSPGESRGGRSRCHFRCPTRRAAEGQGRATSCQGAVPLSGTSDTKAPPLIGRSAKGNLTYGGSLRGWRKLPLRFWPHHFTASTLHGVPTGAPPVGTHH